MARFEAQFVVMGAGDVTLPVSFLDEDASTITDSPVEARFAIQNTLDRVVTFPSILVEKIGSAAHKVSVSLLSNAVTLNANETVENTLIVEPNEPLFEGDEVTLRISGAE